MPASHPLTETVRLSLPQPLPEPAGAYLALLDRRLQALAALAEGTGPPPPDSPADRRLARRFLQPLEGSWHDGDENLVRGYLDRWLKPGQDAGVAAARGLLEAAQALGRKDTRPETLWFLLWEMESILAGLTKGLGPC